MDLPARVHAFTLTAEFPDRTVEVTPTAVETAAGLLLVDVGFEATVEQLRDRLSEAGFGFEDVRYLLLTHEDADHVAGAETVVAESDAVVVAHEREAPAIDGRRGLRGGGGSDRYPPVSVDVEVGGPLRVRTLAGPAEVLPTPGHTSGHVSVSLPEVRTLLAADALTAEDGTLAGPNPRFTGDMERAMASAADLAALDLDRVVCHHGGAVAAGSARIADVVAAYDSE